MKSLEYYLYPRQEKLFEMVKSQFRGKCILRKKSYILVKGEAPVMLLAHMDTVHKEPVKDICRSADGNILMSPQGIGGDDRCGVYGLISCYEMSLKKPWLLFTCDEEIGGRGADAFAKDYRAGRLPKALDKLKLLIELDRKGSNDAVYYDCGNTEFEDYITSKGFETDYGSFSDISTIAPDMGIAAVNLSSGYYNAHTQHEYIVRSELKGTINKACSIIYDSCKKDFPRYEYIRAVYDWSKYYKQYGWSDKWDSGWESWNAREEEMYREDLIPSDLPAEYEDMYEDLLDFYTSAELNDYRAEYGDHIIQVLYETEFFPEREHSKEAI